MDKLRGKQQLEDDVEVPPNIDFDLSDAEDDKSTFVIHRSKEEYDSFQNKKCAESGNEAVERSQLVTVSVTNYVRGMGPIYSSIARLCRPSRRISIESFLRTVNPPSILTEDDLASIRGQNGFPNEVQLCLPFSNERADNISEGWICMYMICFECGLRLLIHPLIIQSMHHYQIAISQLMPNGMRVSTSLIVIADEATVELTVDDFLTLYYP